MHLKSVKYACKYALKLPKYALKHKNMHLKTPKHQQQMSKLFKICAYFYKKSNFFSNVQTKKYFPDLLNG
jgi:hypothetical protein